jgi:hypothetical protein
MKRSRFTEEQIIAVLREQEAGVSTAEVCRKQRQLGDFLQVEVQIRRTGGVRCQAAAGAGEGNEMFRQIAVASRPDGYRIRETDGPIVYEFLPSPNM